jgi:hypothetical protein
MAVGTPPIASNAGAACRSYGTDPIGGALGQFAGVHHRPDLSTPVTARGGDRRET